MPKTTFKNDMHITGEVSSDGTFVGDFEGNLTGDVTGSVRLPTFTVAGLPAASTNARRVVYCSNGDAGSPCLAVSNGSNWLRIELGAAVATS